jgi:23S rRNA pseudouridine1911/1915/1917 synthase
VTGAPERSAAAQRFDPPLRRLDWRLSRRATWSELLADARARLADGERAESAFWHGGLHVGGRPVLPEAAPAEVPAGSWIRLYAFLREPEPVALPEGWRLHEDDELVVAAKPAWLTMQGCRASQRLSLEAALRARLGAPQLVAVHRLDRQTSGVALFAKGAEAARALGRAFASRRVTKRYLALVAPPPGEEVFEMRGSLVRVAHPRRPCFALAPEGAAGRASHSRFRVLGRLAGGRALLLAEPSTGRTHQLRVHLAARGAPIVGDDLYGPPFAPGAPSAASRTQLHAWQLELPAGEGPARRFEAPPPGDFEAAPALVPCPIRPPGPARGVEPSWT